MIELDIEHRCCEGPRLFEDHFDRVVCLHCGVEEKIGDYSGSQQEHRKDSVKGLFQNVSGDG